MFRREMLANHQAQPLRKFPAFSAHIPARSHHSAVTEAELQALLPDCSIYGVSSYSDDDDNDDADEDESDGDAVVVDGGDEDNDDDDEMALGDDD